MKREVKKLLKEPHANTGRSLLISMTNDFIEYRNQIYDSCCNLDTGEIYDGEDWEYIHIMDLKIEEVIHFLEGDMLLR